MFGSYYTDSPCITYSVQTMQTPYPNYFCAFYGFLRLTRQTD